MIYGNKVFNVNGMGSEGLLMAMQLVFLQSGHGGCSSWKQTKEHGLVLCWTNAAKESHPFPADLTPEDLLPIVEKWLKSDFAKEVEFGENCGMYENGSMGWQVFCEMWGHVGDEHYSICAIRPAFCWIGK